MKQHLFLLVLLSLLSVLPLPHSVQASCIVSTPAQRLAWSSVVFRGRVTAIDPEPSAPSAVYFGPQRISFTADSGWKGAVTPTMVVTNRLGSGDFRFAHGEEYLVYATGDSPDAWQTDSCLGTKPIATAADDLGFLGPGTPPGEPRMPGLPNTGGGMAAGVLLWPVIDIGLVAAILAGVGLRWKRRRAKVEHTTRQ